MGYGGRIAAAYLAGTAPQNATGTIDNATGTIDNATGTIDNATGTID